MYSRLQNEYEILTRPAEIQNVVLVAEKLPAPAEIDLSWVRRHESILTRVLLDESLRDVLDTIRRDSPRLARDLELDAKRDHLYEHLRADILHYQRAIWQREDPQQRSMRYRKSGRKVPLEWRFELESGPTLTIDELGDRLSAPNVDGQFASYSGGREAELDQVIDPAGPVAYYGNYAVYRMRPEFGSADLFSMLHFFKSPYLRPNVETGEPEVADPLQIEISRDPAVAAPSERVRRIVLDTDGLVIDVIRSAAPEREAPEPDLALELGVAPEGYELFLEDARGLGRVSSNGHRAADAEWVIIRDGGGRTPSLLAGAGGGALRAHHEEGEPMFIERDDGTQAPGLRVGRAHEPDTERVILAREDGRGLTSVAGAGASQAQAGVLLSRGDAGAPGLCVGHAHHPDGATVILVRSDGRLRLAAGAEGDAAKSPERAILAEGNAVGAPSLLTGSGTSLPDERVIVARDARLLKITSVAAAGASQARERVFLEGGDGARTPSLLAGRAHDAETTRVLLARDVRGLRLISGTGARAVPAHERVILARGAGSLRPSLIAG